MKKTIIALVGVSALLLTGCSDTFEQDMQQNQDEITFSYRGEDIHCVVTWYDRSASASCDYQRFYAEHPELIKE